MASAASSQEPVVLRSEHGAVTRLTLNRPRAYNSLNRAMLDALLHELHTLDGDSRCRVIVLAGAGPAFCSGHDLKEMRDGRTGDSDSTSSGPDAAFVREIFTKCSQVMQQLRSQRQVVVARVAGVAAAAGMQLVGASDLAIAARGATFGTSGIRVGLFCSTPAVPLVRSLPRKACFELLATGDLIDAQRALELGVVNRVVEPEQLDAAVAELADRIAAHSGAAMALGKRTFYRQLELPEREAYACATDAMVTNATHQDVAEGIDAFFAKRPPKWSDR